MYKDYEDPWEQTTREEWSSEKAVALNLLQKVKAKRVIELGCGLGHYTQKIKDLNIDVLGIDISETAISKAKITYPKCKFETGDILDYEIYNNFKPDVIIMSEITWYVLDKLDEFKKFIKTNFPNTYIIHLLTTYPKGVQKHGKDKFTNLDEIKSYFKAEYLEWGEISYPEMEGCKRTYFIGKL